MPGNNEKLISVREAAKECGRNTETVRRWIWAGKLPAEKLGNQLFIKKKDLASYCRENAVIGYEARPKPDLLERPELSGKRIQKEGTKPTDTGKAIYQTRRGRIKAKGLEPTNVDKFLRQTLAEHDNKPRQQLDEGETNMKAGSRATLIKKMRKLREEIRARVGNLDATEMIEQLRQERMND